MPGFRDEPGKAPEQGSVIAFGRLVLRDLLFLGASAAGAAGSHSHRACTKKLRVWLPGLRIYVNAYRATLGQVPSVDLTSFLWLGDENPTPKWFEAPTLMMVLLCLRPSSYSQRQRKWVELAWGSAMSLSKF